MREGDRACTPLFLGESKLGANRVSVSGILVKALNAVFPLIYNWSLGGKPIAMKWASKAEFEVSFFILSLQIYF